MLTQFAFAQKSVMGKVIAASNNQPISGASVILKGKSKGVSTNVDGVFSIEASTGDVLIVSGVGIKNQEHTISAGGIQVIVVDAEVSELNEVVVTALGIRKDRKKLGYAIQDIKGEALTVARETNVVNQLAGKVAGVT
ncbi:MAG: hypothetical protein RLZZ520_1526, partial [Bacteroidota bacterium]